MKNLRLFFLITLVATSLKAQEVPEVFAAGDLAAIYTEEVSQLPGGYVLPVSRRPLTSVYLWANAPRDLKDDWGPFQFVSRAKAFIHLGEAPNADRAGDIYDLFVDLPSYLGILQADGQPLFRSMSPIDSSGRRLSSFPTPPGPSVPTVRYGRSVVSIQSINLTIDIQVEVVPAVDGYRVEIFNPRPVRYGIFGQVIPAGGLFIQVDFYAYKKGWLVHGISRFDIAPFVARLIKDPSVIGSYGASIANWIAEETVYPIAPRSTTSSF